MKGKLVVPTGDTFTGEAYSQGKNKTKIPKRPLKTIQPL